MSILFQCLAPKNRHVRFLDKKRNPGILSIEEMTIFGRCIVQVWNSEFTKIDTRKFMQISGNLSIWGMFFSACVGGFPSAAISEGLGCADVYRNAVRSIKIDTRQRSAEAFLFGLYCEASGETKDFVHNGSVGFPIQGVPLEISGDNDWSESELKEFCKVGASSGFYETKEFSYGSSVVVEALAQFNQCVVLQGRKLKVTHEEVAPAGFIIYGEFLGSVDAKITSVAYEPTELECTSTSFNASGKNETIDGSRMYDPRKENFTIQCTRIPQGDQTHKLYPRTWFQMGTSVGPYSIILPGDSVFGLQLASEAQAALDAAIASRNGAVIERDSARSQAATEGQMRARAEARLSAAQVLKFYRGDQPQPSGFYNYQCGPFTQDIAVRECTAIGGTLKQLELVMTTQGGPCGHSYWTGLCIPN